MKKILIIGDLIIDHYLIGDCQRISPEAPVPIVNASYEKLILGGAGNVINNIISLDGKADIVSVVGDCKNNQTIKNLLDLNNISTKFLITEKNRITSKKTRIIASKQQIVRFDKEDTRDISSDTENKLLTIYKKIITQYSVVVLSDYGKGLLTDNLTKNLITIANTNNIKVLVDPKGSDYLKYSGAYLLTPNKNEAELATNLVIDNNNLILALKKLKNNFKLTKSIITLSENGIALFDDKLQVFPTKAREVFDVTGAGDTVIAAIAFCLANGDNINQAIKFANLAAGVVVAKVGSSTATIDEIYNTQHNIKTTKQINKIVKTLKKQNKKIVFTNGCFDILHLGHIKYLEEAKKMGDILIVGVNSDSSVKQLKGKSRPINPEFDRAYLLNSLKVVDFVIIFTEETPYNLIKGITPDILVKGADYKGKKVIGSDIATHTRLIEFVDGKSTTKIIKKINNDKTIL